MHQSSATLATPATWSALSRSRGPSRQLRRAGASALVVLALALAGCGPSPATTSPGSVAPTAASPTTVPTASASAGASEAASAASSPAVSLPTQTDTAWGRIWDALPPSFPIYPGAQAAPTTSGPASASLTTSAGVAAVATWLVDSLGRAGFQVKAGPALEDGSHVIDITGSTSGCKAQAQVRPEGSLTSIVILYGAACPFG